MLIIWNQTLLQTIHMFESVGLDQYKYLIAELGAIDQQLSCIMNSFL